MLILARHGRTFPLGTQAVYIGAQQDPPLTGAGAAEAKALGQALAPLPQDFAVVQASPMRRTREHAELAVEGAGFALPVHMAPALRELHYGRWAGRSRDDIIAQGDGDALRAWDHQGVYPSGVGFEPEAQEQKQTLRQWMQRCHTALNQAPQGWMLAVTHGGILRLLAAFLQAHDHAAPQHKIACGHLVVLQAHKASWRVLAYNVPPEGAQLKALYDACGATRL